MKVISHIYEQYQIMPALQLHQYRVAAVASMICDHFGGVLERNEIISACLLHDMGNILKFDLEKFPEFLQPQGKEYWEGIKAEFARNYGGDEHVATIAIAEEVGVSLRTIELIKSISYVPQLLDPAYPEMSAKICEYCDLRVTPFGITSMADRWQDLQTRYQKKNASEERQQRLVLLQKNSQVIEDEIFSHCSISPDGITQASASDVIAALHDFVVV